MAKIGFKKNNFKAFFIFLLIITVISAGMAIGLYCYFGQSIPGDDITEGFGDKLSYGSSFSLADIVEEEQYNYAWINSDDIIVEVYAINNENEEVLTEEILAYSTEERTFKVVGVSKGIIKFINGFDETVNFSVPFTTKFKSDDTNALLTDNYPQFIEDGVFTQSELSDIQIIRINKFASVDLNDFKLFESLKKIEIIDTPENAIISFENFELPSSTNVYVQEAQYLDYINNDDPIWQNYIDRIYPIVANTSSHSIVLYKNGGVFNDDNGELISNFEVEDGGSVSLSTTYAITKPGYRFLGWYSSNGEPVNDAELVSDSYKFKSDMKLFAKWQANSYTIRLHHNDGTDEYTEKQFTYDSASVICDKPLSYSGFIQIGWANTADNTEVLYENEQIIKNITVTNNDVIDVYAIWVYRTFSVQFYTWDTQQEYKEYGSIIQCSYGDDISLNSILGAPESVHGSFKGWALNQDAPKAEYNYNDVITFESVKEFLTSKTDGVLRIYPIFQLQSYDLSYDANGGSTTPSGENGISRGTQINLSKQIEREGYKFKGWLDNAGYLWTSESLYQSDRAYYDTYYPNKVEILAENEYGYSAPIGMEHVQVSKVTLTAVWVANTFKVVFAGNKTNSSYYNSATVTYGKEYSFIGEISKVGHTLSSCVSNYGAVSLKGRVLSAKQVADLYNALRGSALNNDFDCSQTVTFNVSWTANTYTITFDYNGGYGNTSTKNVVYGTAYGTLPSASRSSSSNCDKGCCYTYYNFSYWKDSTGKEITESTSMRVSANHTLTAVWTSENVEKDHCLASGTLITMADGSTKAIEDVSVGDAVRVWDLEQGVFSSSIVACIEHDGMAKCTVVDLIFADNTTVTLITEHGFFDCDLNEYVYITPDNVYSYIGHAFFRMNEENGVLSYSEVELVDAKVETRVVGTHSMVTADQISHFANGYLSIAAGIDGLFNIFEVTDDMKYDAESVQKDIDTYGLYTYEDFAEYVTYEEFVAFNGAYLKISVGKGLTTFDKIIEMINRYLR